MAGTVRRVPPPAHVNYSAVPRAGRARGGPGTGAPRPREPLLLPVRRAAAGDGRGRDRPWDGDACLEQQADLGSQVTDPSSVDPGRPPRREHVVGVPLVLPQTVTSGVIGRSITHGRGARPAVPRSGSPRRAGRAAGRRADAAAVRRCSRGTSVAHVLTEGGDVAGEHRQVDVLVLARRAGERLDRPATDQPPRPVEPVEEGAATPAGSNGSQAPYERQNRSSSARSSRVSSSGSRTASDPTRGRVSAAPYIFFMPSQSPSPACGRTSSRGAQRGAWSGWSGRRRCGRSRRRGPTRG